MNSDLENKLDRLLGSHMKVAAPAGLFTRTMARLPRSRIAPIPWWSWAVYAAFFTTTVAGLAYWEWGALVSVAGLLFLYIPKLIALIARYPTFALMVMAAFVVNALVFWFVAADLVLKKRVNGVMVR
jgi:hypothetical protein